MIMPQLLVKRKEIIMDMKRNLLELEETAQRISDGLAAVRIMVVGLDGAGSEYTGAFHAIWDYLSEAEEAFQKQLSICLETV